jgi:hypothetical protein
MRKVTSYFEDAYDAIAAAFLLVPVLGEHAEHDGDSALDAIFELREYWRQQLALAEAEALSEAVPA